MVLVDQQYLYRSSSSITQPTNLCRQLLQKLSPLLCFKNFHISVRIAGSYGKVMFSQVSVHEEEGAIQSTSRQYASWWNAFLFSRIIILKIYGVRNQERQFFSLSMNDMTVPLKPISMWRTTLILKLRLQTHLSPQRPVARVVEIITSSRASIIRGENNQTVA